MHEGVFDERLAANHLESQFLVERYCTDIPAKDPKADFSERLLLGMPARQRQKRRDDPPPARLGIDRDRVYEIGAGRRKFVKGLENSKAFFRYARIGWWIIREIVEGEGVQTASDLAVPFSDLVVLVEVGGA